FVVSGAAMKTAQVRIVLICAVIGLLIADRAVGFIEIDETIGAIPIASRRALVIGIDGGKASVMYDAVYQQKTCPTLLKLINDGKSARFTNPWDPLFMLYAIL